MPREPEDAPDVAVTVVRTGGFAGLTRTWHVEVPASSAIADLVARCPWEHCGAPAEGADRFVWSVSAVCGTQQRHAELAERDLHGPWRELIDAVRAGSASAASPQE